MNPKQLLAAVAKNFVKHLIQFCIGGWRTVAVESQAVSIDLSMIDPSGRIRSKLLADIRLVHSCSNLVLNLVVIQKRKRIRGGLAELDRRMKLVISNCRQSR